RHFCPRVWGPYRREQQPFVCLRERSSGRGELRLRRWLRALCERERPAGHPPGAEHARRRGGHFGQRLLTRNAEAFSIKRPVRVRRQAERRTGPASPRRSVCARRDGLGMIPQTAFTFLGDANHVVPYFTGLSELRPGNGRAETRAATASAAAPTGSV